MSIQDDIFDISNSLEGSIDNSSAFDRIIQVFSELEVENIRLAHENNTLKSAIKIIEKETS